MRRPRSECEGVVGHLSAPDRVGSNPTSTACCLGPRQAIAPEPVILSVNMG